MHTSHLTQTLTHNDVASLPQDEARLDVYVDGVPAAEDASGRRRVYARPRFDPWRRLVVGGANDAVRQSRPLPDVHVYNLTHWDKYYWSEDVARYYREYPTSTQVDEGRPCVSVRVSDQSPEGLRVLPNACAPQHRWV